MEKTKFNLNELYIYSGQDKVEHLCIFAYHFLDKEDPLYKWSKKLSAPIGWYYYRDFFDTSIVKLNDVRSSLFLSYVLKKMEKSCFLSRLEQRGISVCSNECTIDEIKTLWEQYQEKKGKSFQKTIGIRK